MSEPRFTDLGLSSQESRVLTLQSSDGVEFKVKESIAIESNKIKNMLEHDPSINTIPLPGVNAETLKEIIDYLEQYAKVKVSGPDLLNSDEHHAEVKVSGLDLLNHDQKDVLENFKEEFVTIKLFTLRDMVYAVGDLGINEAFCDLCCKSFARRIENKTVEASRKILNVTSDFTEEEEAAIRETYYWAFEGDLDDTID